MLLLFLLSFFTDFDNDDPTLAVDNIPVMLTHNADAVIRYDEVTCTVASLDKMEISVNHAVTILNENNGHLDEITIYYRDKADVIKDLRIEIYDRDGKLIKKVKNKEIDDIMAYDGFSVAGDYRYKYLHYTSNTYPYTIKYSYVKISKNSLSVPDWYPLRSTRVGIEKSKYQIIKELDDFDFNIKAFNIPSGGSIKIDTVQLLFNALNVNAIKIDREKVPYYKEYLPYVKIVPKHFKYYGIEGRFDDWASYGKWMYDHMLDGRNDLPDKLINEIDAIIPNEGDNMEKAKAIYEYVVNNTRYVSIQLGIGGWKPFSPSDVYDWKYGDCKALSFFTGNIMRHYGVEAIYTEIYSDDKYNISYNKDIAGPSGNHIILCLPNDGDTLWVDCTNKILPFGYTHNAIDNRRALLIKPNGGELVMTKRYEDYENLAVYHVKMGVENKDNTPISIKSTYNGIRYEEMFFLDYYEGNKKIEIYEDKYLSAFSMPKIMRFDPNANRDDKVYSLDVEIVAYNFLESAGDYKVIPYAIIGLDYAEPIHENRLRDIYIKDGAKDSLVFDVMLPDGYEVVKKDFNINFVNNFGSIKRNSHMLDQSTIRVEIVVEQKSGAFPPQEVKNYNLFINEYIGLKNDKIVLKPKT